MATLASTDNPQSCSLASLNSVVTVAFAGCEHNGYSDATNGGTGYCRVIGATAPLAAKDVSNFHGCGPPFITEERGPKCAEYAATYAAATGCDEACLAELAQSHAVCAAAASER